MTSDIPAPRRRMGRLPVERWPWQCEAVPANEWGRGGAAEMLGDRLPRITVVTPSFNQGEFLEETIRSVLLQGYPNLDYIVVDGGSSDASGEVLDHYADAITHVIREPDDGQSDAICKGLKLASGDLFNWINSDDRLAEGALWELATRCRADADLYAMDVSVEDAGGDPPAGSEVRMFNRNLSAVAMLRCDRYSFSQPGLWFRMESLRACGGIDASLNYGFDWDLIVRYLAMYPRVQYSSSIGAMFRLHEQSKTMVETNKADASENRFEQENARIRDKLERTLPPRLAAASRLGRRRDPWNRQMIEVLDDYDRSPVAASFGILRDAMNDPAARLSKRTFGAVSRLLSRYVRKGWRKPDVPVA